MKKLFKKISFLNDFNSAFKACCQERSAERNYKYYLRKTSENQGIKSNGDIASALRKRLLQRGINPAPKKMGNLNIFLAYSMCNWEKILPLALRPFGTVTEFEWRSHGYDDLSPDWLSIRDTMNAQMLRVFQDAHAKQPIDAFVGYLSGYYVDPSILDMISKSGAAIFNFCWDDKLNYPGEITGGRYTSPAAIASVVDLNLTNSPESVIKYAAHGGLAMFWPEAAQPDTHKPYDVPFDYDVTFAGAKYGWRPKFIEKLRKIGVKVECFGYGWENGPLTDEEMIRLYSRSRINLGFAGVGHSRKLMCLKGRDFEIPMAGGLYLTQDNPELSLVYDIGKEIMTYKDEKDCADKIKQLISNPDKADMIRKAGRNRALNNHSWEKRFERVFDIAGLIAAKSKG